MIITNQHEMIIPFNIWKTWPLEAMCKMIGIPKCQVTAYLRDG